MAARTKAPAFQFYPQDFIMGCAMMSAEEVGGYIRLLCYQWEHGSIPDDDTMLSRLSGCGGNAVASIRHKFGICQEGKLMNARLEQVRAEQDAYRNRQSENAAKRWSNMPKVCGGNAVGMPTQCGGNAVGMPTHMPDVCPTPTPTPTPTNNNTLRLEASPAAEAKAEKPKAERKRDELFDALASATGSDPKQMTPTAARACGVALAEIKKATPTVTPEEIRLRVASYKKIYRDAACTPSAMKSHWAECSNRNNSQQIRIAV